ncbi:RNA-binding protein [candidate division WWE3 bacterium CG09_land_8_20_14_0_10_47_33]|uniref:RNA-binding protein KhpA n=1 Tax=candidate division WWE3 bacterium CG_4_9_14_0_2_um_filter_48_10 TaxID=1975078 RepID=A0A2M8EI42_UNCKA|nr:MAG: RNA-binding protein [candidate division WWE3 bacterium CG09_land_8_20_14_0_10_47_33]PIZ41247.1 MAG: RNA-binding protein [candidate division WWE3 bacterium CG_4_10_14_0_2_um_filter_47_8]PJC22143.1 MAG: RNA-binding protein [candidate division WWE3 bacterium CG_4_9_14_0_2_um_filter_48_10]PJE52328.1 MAG: RNA-binding protein [candidate division WWE3 bacterium CG10_big_fil_rev_8_21_14_0_10_48_23]
MKELLKYLVKELVSKPKEVKITESQEEDGTVHLTLSVAPEDMGTVIGKDGKTITAIRSLVKTAAVKAGKKVFLELEEREEK